MREKISNQGKINGDSITVGYSWMMMMMMVVVM
jgi:hypothetical protein